MTTEQLIQRIEDLERQVREAVEKTDQLQRKSVKILDTALHAYKTDEYGFLWTYDAETKTYHKTRMRVMTPEIAAEAVGPKQLAEGAVTGDKLENGAVVPGKIADDAVQERNIKDGSVSTNKLADFAVATAKILNKAVTSDKLSDEAVLYFKNAFQEIIDDLKNEIDSYDEHGIALSNNFGDDPHIGISQKTLTAAVNMLWQKIQEITGEQLLGFELNVTPEYYIGEDGATVEIAANNVGVNGIFEHIEFQINGSVVAQADNVETLSYEGTITETSIVKVVAKILGVTYEQQKTITHYNSFWLGCGTDYTDVMDGNTAHVIPISNGMRGQYNVSAEAGDHIIIIVGESLAAGFIRADINGVEIPFTSETITVDGVQYRVFTSENTYQAGTYNIDING